MNRFDEVIYGVLNKARDSRRENVLVRMLCGLNREEALEHVWELISNNSPAALDIAKRVIKHKSGKIKIFRHYVRKADASSIQYILEFGLSGLGEKEVIRILKEYCSNDPTLWEKCSYWLPSLVSTTGIESLKNAVEGE